MRASIGQLYKHGARSDATQRATPLEAAEAATHGIGRDSGAGKKHGTATAIAARCRRGAGRPALKLPRRPVAARSWPRRYKRGRRPPQAAEAARSGTAVAAAVQARAEAATAAAAFGASSSAAALTAAVGNTQRGRQRRALGKQGRRAPNEPRLPRASAVERNSLRRRGHNARVAAEQRTANTQCRRNTAMQWPCCPCRSTWSALAHVHWQLAAAARRLSRPARHMQPRSVAAASTARLGQRQ